MQETLLALEILLISVILSVDNALVIGLATRQLSGDLQRRAIFWGTMGAVVLRIVFSAIAVVLINTPYLKLVGGVFLLYIAYKMLADSDDEHSIRQGRGLMSVVQIIVLADLMVSVDNVLAIVAIADGNWLLLLMGILVSIPCILWGSRAISKLLHRFPFLLYAGVAVLAWTGATMILDEPMVAAFVQPLGIPNGAFHVISVVATTAAAVFAKRRFA